MVEKYTIRTDLAMEQKERFESDHVEVSGVVLEEEYDEEREIKITTVRIETENGAKMMGKRWEHILHWKSLIWHRQTMDITERYQKLWQDFWKNMWKMRKRKRAFERKGMLDIDSRAW